MSNHKRAVSYMSTQNLVFAEKEIIRKGRYASWWEKQRLPHVTRELETRFYKNNNPITKHTES